MKFLYLILIATFPTLPITCALRKSSTKHHVAATHSKTTKPIKTTIVDSQWMEAYKRLETKFDYNIPADVLIKTEGSKFRVPQAVIDHFGDMTKAQ
jgi:hypothetical protein